MMHQIYSFYSQDMSYQPFKPTTSQIRAELSNNYRDLNGLGIDFNAQNSSILQWTEPAERVVISGSSDVTLLSTIRGALLQLKQDFFTGNESIVINGDRRQLAQRRLLHLEHEIDGLLKRKINYTVKEGETGRVLDYTGILNQKEVQIVELQKKIQNFEERLRRATKRQGELENQIVRLKEVIRSINNPNFKMSDFEKLTVGYVEFSKLQEKYAAFRNQVAAFGGLFNSHLNKLRSTNFKFDNQAQFRQLLTGQQLQVRIIDGVANIVDYREKVVQVPVQDSRTKHLIHLLASQMKKYHDKYPKLKQEIDVRLSQFFQGEIIDILEADDFQRVVEIVKYVPEFYRVENVYAYSCQKSRRVEFHLRVLIKALLEELEKVKRKSGLVLDIDQGIIGMINQQIIDLVSVDDILKVFRVVPKIVEVEKIVEKIVQRVVQVPQVIAVERIVQRPIQIIKIQQIERVIHVPVQIIRYVDQVVQKIVEVQSYSEKIVQVPRIIERIVERIVQIPKVVEVEVVVERIVEVQKPIYIEKIVNHTVPQIREVQVIKQKVVVVQKIIKQIVEVEVVKEKIVQRVVQVIKPFDRIIQKPVEVIKYRNARQVVNHIVQLPQIVEVFIQRCIPIVQTVEKIVEVIKVVPQLVQVKVQVVTVKEVKVIQEKIVYRDRIKEVEKVVNHTVTLVKQVQKIIDRRVQVPFYQEKILRVPEIVTQICIQRVQIPRIVQVTKTVDKIVEVNNIIEVEKPVNVYITQNNPVRIVVEKIVQVPRTVQRIKEVRVHIDKIIQKMVEVPKVVQVEKIVEKIVVVPRVVEKIVEVVQIVEKLVDRIVQVQRVVQVEKIVQVPIIQEKIVEVQVIKNIYNQVDRVVEKIVEKIVAVERNEQKVKVVKQQSQKIVEVRVEVPKEIFVDRIVTKVVQVDKVIEIDRPTIVPIQVPVPVDRIIEKVIVCEKVVERAVQCLQQIEKIVQVRTEQCRIEQVVKVVQKPIFKEKIKQVEKVTPYISERVVQIEVQCPIPVPQIQERIVEVPTIIQKVITICNQIPRVYQVQRLCDRVITVPQLIELPCEIPVIVHVNQVVECIRQRPIQIPLLHQQIKTVQILQQKVVAIEKCETVVKQVVSYRDKICEVQKLVIKQNLSNVIQNQIQYVDRFEEKVIPVCSTIEKIIEVPYILEKIVQKIVIMPQVVEVIKYVHEMCEEASLGVAVNVDINAQEIKYKQLYANIRIHFERVLAELRKLKVQTPGLKIQIQIIETFLIELDGIIKFPRIVQVEVEKKVEVEVNRPVIVPTKDETSIRNEVALSLLVDKLISEIRCIKQSNPGLKLNLDQDLQLIFFSEAFNNGKLSGQFNNQLRSYKQSQYNRLFSLGKTWTNDHDLIINTILEERFTLANTVKNANLEIEKAKAIADQRLQAYRILRQSHTLLTSKLENIQRQCGVIVNSQGTSGRNEISKILANIGQLRGVLAIDPRTLRAEENVFVLGDIHGSEDGYIRLQSAFRALQKQNSLLRERYVKWQKEIPSATIVADKERIIESLSKQLSTISSELSTLRRAPTTNVNVTGNTQQYEIKIRTLNSRIQELESQLRAQKIDFDGQIRTKNQLIRELEDKLSIAGKPEDSRVTNTNFGSNSNIDKLTSSVHSNSSGSGSQIASSYVTGSNVSNNSSNISSGVTKPYGGYTSNTSATQQTSSYGNSGYKPTTYGTNNSTTTGLVGATVGSSNIVSGSNVTATYGSGSSNNLSSSGRFSGVATGNTGATYATGNTGTTGTTLTSGTSSYGNSGITGASSYGTSGISGQNRYGTSGVSGSISATGSISGATGTVTGATTLGSSSSSGTTGSSYQPYSSYSRK